MQNDNSRLILDQNCKELFSWLKNLTIIQLDDSFSNIFYFLQTGILWNNLVRILIHKMAMLQTNLKFQNLCHIIWHLWNDYLLRKRSWIIAIQIWLSQSINSAQEMIKVKFFLSNRLLAQMRFWSRALAHAV